MSLTRRAFLTSLGAVSYAALAPHLSPAADFPAPRRRGKAPTLFAPIEPSSEDQLKLPKGYCYDLVIQWGDPLGSKAPDGSAESFGFNNDFITYFPLNIREGQPDAGEGLLWVNHEYPNPLFLSGYTPAEYKAGKPKTKEQIIAERLSVGGSVVHVKRDAAGAWKPVVPSMFNRRLTASYPEMKLSGPAADILKTATGTLANCSGGQTPWFTALSCEENYPDYNGTDPKDFFYRWSDVEGMAIDETRYGWMVEVDPFGELPPMKHTALGRFKHENAAVTVGPTGKFVVYMGDDEVDQHLYKFVSKNALPKNASRAEQRKVLEEGTLFVADLAKGQWIPLVWNDVNAAIIGKSPALAEAVKKDATVMIRNQGELLIHTRIAAKALGATPLDRCEDCELHPIDGSLYVALTNNTKHGNLFGHIVRLVEDGNNPEGDSFRYEIFLAGGPQSGLACPDNLAFDKSGNLWVVCDMSSDKMGKGAYKPFGNNGLFYVPTTGENAGDAYQFASGPKDCELTGPWFTADGSTLFLSVQHPGEMSTSLKADGLTSHWPAGGNAQPRPAVVAIRGFTW